MSAAVVAFSKIVRLRTIGGSDKVTAAANGLVLERCFLQEDVAGYTAAAQALQTG